MRRIGRHTRFKRFINDITTYTPVGGMVLLLIILWLTFSAGLYLAEQGVKGASIDSYGEALYWGVAAFSTAGIADTPTSGLGQFVGGMWIVIGSVLFFGTSVATVTTYFMRPFNRQHNQ